MNKKTLAVFVLLAATVVPAAQAEIKHIAMRVEGMT
jgi:hypothetical protein